MIFPFGRKKKKTPSNASTTQKNAKKTISRNDVIMCYRAILGRKPESEKVIEEYQKIDKFSTLRKIFISSTEFQDQFASEKSASLPFMALDLPRNAIEYDISAEQLTRCLAKIKTVWSHLGVTKPHFSVLTHSDFLPENLQGNIEAFWSSGEAEAAQLERMLDRYGLANLSEKVCLEYGCGVGRVCVGLSHRFRMVNCYDISPGHLALAAQRAESAEATNVNFHLCSENLLEPLVKCDFFFSRIVFQHNPPPVIYQLVKNALQSLNPEGIAIIQFPTYRVNYSFSLTQWLAAKETLEMEMHCLPQHAVYSLVASENCEVLEVREDGYTGYSHHFVSNTFVIRKRK